MKKYLFSAILIIMTAISQNVFADTTVVTEEIGYPITVEKDYYTVSTPHYYYYTGHRCYVKERTGVSANVLGLRARISGGSKIYCYPYP